MCGLALYRGVLNHQQGTTPDNLGGTRTGMALNYRRIIHMHLFGQMSECEIKACATMVMRVEKDGVCLEKPTGWWQF